MPYELKRYNNDRLVTVPDSQNDTLTTSLTFIGKNFAGYGADQNENFLYLLENFARGTAPQKPITGQIWYDSQAKKLKYYDETISGTNKWRTTGGSYVGTVDPSQTNALNIGDLWFDEDTKQLKAWSGLTFVLVGPQAVSGAGTTNLESVSVTDDVGGTHPIIKASIGGIVMYIISNSSFTLASSNSITGFSYIREGITLKNSSTTGITDIAASTRFWGTASDSDKLGGLAANTYVQKGSASFSALAAFPNAGITIGNPALIKIFVDESNSNLGTIQNLISSTLSIKVRNPSTNDTLNPIVVSLYNVNPGAHQTYDLGTDALQWNKLYAKDVYATNFHGALVGGTSEKSDTLKYARATPVNSYVSATDESVANTIVARDNNSNFAANIITAVATQARYADLAEKYDADAIYDPGTVVVFGGVREITVTTIEEDTRVAGVISTNPAYLMNVESEGLAVALRGKVPCKVIGPIKKGDILVSSSVLGYAMASRSNNPLAASIIGKSLEDKFDLDLGTIMIVVT